MLTKLGAISIFERDLLLVLDIIRTGYAALQYRW